MTESTCTAEFLRMPGGADADGVRQYAARCGCRILVYMICA
ncbi:MAG: hypothetical protein ACLVFU_01815 [Eggerthellaceae bacterium]